MKKLLSAGLGAFFYLATSLSGQTNAISPLEQRISSYKAEMDSCLNNFSRTNATKEEIDGFFVDIRFALEKYEKFRDCLGSNDLGVVESDAQLSAKAIEMYLKKAERNINESEFDTKRPNISSIENSLELYQKAYGVLKKLNLEEFTAPAKRIESGFAKVIIGLRNFKEFNEKDLVMNPEGNVWEFNPMKKIEEIDNDLKEKITYSEQWGGYKRVIEKSLKGLETAADSKNESETLYKMINSAQWMTSLLMTNKTMFVQYFPRYESALKPAKELVEKKYSKKEMAEFDKWHKNLPDYHKLITSATNSPSKK